MSSPHIKRKKRKKFEEGVHVFGEPVYVDEVLDLPLEKKAVGLLLQGESIAEVSKAISKPEWWVAEVAKKGDLHKEAVEFRKELVRNVLKDKGPLLQEIAGLSLEIVRDRLIKMMQTPEEMMALSPRDLKEITAIAATVDGMERLEKGKSTQNIAIAFSSPQDFQDKITVLQSTDPMLMIDEPDKPN